MGMFDWLFPNKTKNNKAHNFNTYFKSLNAYSPVFTTTDGGLYEMELTRAAIHSFATAVSKLKPEVVGDKYNILGKRMNHKMNDHMVTSKFLYRLATILMVNTTAYIIPLYEKDGYTIRGYYPLLPLNTEVVEAGGEQWLRFSFANGEKTAMKLEEVGILTQYQYKNEFMGDGHRPLSATMSLIDIQNQGMQEAVKQSAKIRFMGQVAMTMAPEDLEKERKRFSASNLSASNDTGMMLFDAKYQNMQQIKGENYVIDRAQMDLIHQNVYSYFGVNQDILQNSFDEDTWNAFYEGKIEPFALQLSQVMSDMTFTDEDLERGSEIIFTTNRLQYASNNTKLQMSTQLLDRGVLSRNEAREIWNMSPIEDGDGYYIRREYGKVGDIEDDEGTDTTENNGDGRRDTEP